MQKLRNHHAKMVAGPILDQHRKPVLFKNLQLVEVKFKQAQTGQAWQQQWPEYKDNDCPSSFLQPKIAGKLGLRAIPKLDIQLASARSQPPGTLRARTVLSLRAETLCLLQRWWRDH